MENAGYQSGPQLNCGLEPGGPGWVELPHNMVAGVSRAARRGSQRATRARCTAFFPSLRPTWHLFYCPPLVQAGAKLYPASKECQIMDSIRGCEERQGHAVRRACGMGIVL